ncbi:MAG: DUF6438 domain-containing protein [Alphaproteobacteria bacterium]
MALVLLAACTQTPAGGASGLGGGAGADAPRDIEVSLTRTPCFGICPSYRVTLKGDGQVRYEGDCFVDVKGVKDYTVDAAAVEKLAKAFEAADFFNLQDEYRAQITDNPTQILSIRIGDRAKSLKDYAGRMVGMPEAVTTLENEVDRVANTAPLVGERTFGKWQNEECRGFGTP